MCSDLSLNPTYASTVSVVYTAAMANFKDVNVWRDYWFMPALLTMNLPWTLDHGPPSHSWMPSWTDSCKGVSWTYDWCETYNDCKVTPVQQHT